MQRVTITLVNGRNKPLREQKVLAHKGVAMHKEGKDSYTFTHVNSGAAIYCDKKMSYKQARVFMTKIVDLVAWDTYHDDILKCSKKGTWYVHPDVEPVIKKLPSLYWETLAEVE